MKRSTLERSCVGRKHKLKNKQGSNALFVFVDFDMFAPSKSGQGGINGQSTGGRSGGEGGQ